MREISISSEDKLLILAPHPDDECIGMGGLLQRYPDLCHIIVFTDGAIADPSIENASMRDQRGKEFCSAMKHAGVKDYNLRGYSDGELLRHPECMDDIDFEKVTKVFLPYVGDGHPDHKAVYAYAIRKMQQLKDKPLVYQYDTRGFMVNPTDYLDITASIDDKKKLIYEYESQIKLFDHAEFIAGINQRNAELCDSKEISCIECYKEVDLTAECQVDIDGEKETARIKRQNDLMQRWLSYKVKGHEISDYLVTQNMKTIGLYGYGEIGKLFFQDLTNGGLKVLWIMDRKAGQIKDTDICIYTPESECESVDVVLVTTLYDVRDISKMLNSKGHNNVIGWWDLFAKMGRYFDEVGK